MLYILDTDHISLLQRDNPQVRANLATIDEEKRAVTVITVVEQIQGWLAFIRRAKKEAEVKQNEGEILGISPSFFIFCLDFDL